MVILNLTLTIQQYDLCLKCQMCSTSEKLRRRVWEGDIGLWTYQISLVLCFVPEEQVSIPFLFPLPPTKRNRLRGWPKTRSDCNSAILHPVQWSEVAASSVPYQGLLLLPQWAVTLVLQPDPKCLLWGKGVESELIDFLPASWKPLDTSKKGSVLLSTAIKFLQTFNNMWEVINIKIVNNI